MHVLITAGPTREYLDAVRFLTNASSGRMGYALARSALGRRWQVTLVTGPVALAAPPVARLVHVVSAVEMRRACLELLGQVDGVIAAAAVADYRPRHRLQGKLRRGTEPMTIELVPNPDILAEIGCRKAGQWTVGFAVEPPGALDHARRKLVRKNCDALVVNSVAAMESANTAIDLLDRTGTVALHYEGPKEQAADLIVAWIAEHLVTDCKRPQDSTP